MSLDWFYAQDKTVQTKLIAYAQIREVEDAQLLQASLSVGLAHGV